MKRLTIGLVLVALLLAGCKGKSIEGKWTATGAGDNAKHSMNVEFTAPDKVTMVMEISGVGGSGKLNITGTYKLDGDTLAINSTDITLDATGPQAAATKKQFEQMKPMMLKDLNDSASGKVVWTDNDKFTFTAGKKPDVTTFTRVK